MAGEQDPKHTPNPQGAGEAGGEKLIFGKYKTLEDAEKAHKELERNFHGSNERFARLEERIELLAQPRQTSQEYTSDEGYGRGAVDSPDKTRVLTEFYQDPVKVLAEVEERATRRVEQRMAQRQQQTQDHAARVQAWTEQNQDVTKYPELLTYWVQQTDGRLSIETRLSKAAEKVRARIIELRGKPDDGEPKADEVIEGPGSASAAAGRPVGKPAAPRQEDPESQLAQYAAGRNRQIRKPLGVPRDK